jgi:hypothetical protein
MKRTPLNRECEAASTHASFTQLVTIRVISVFVAIVACAVDCDCCVLAADEESPAANNSSEESAAGLPVVELADRKAEIVAGTGSPDGRLALAWTLRRLKGAEPVDWDLLGKDREKFKETYGDDESYFVELLVVDYRHNKSLATLKLDKSWSLPGYGHESLVARWGPADNNGRRFAIVNCDHGVHRILSFFL